MMTANKISGRSKGNAAFTDEILRNLVHKDSWRVFDDIALHLARWNRMASEMHERRIACYFDTKVQDFNCMCCGYSTHPDSPLWLFEQSRS